MLQGDRGNHLYIGSKTIITRRDKSGREIFEFFILKDREAKKERGREKNLRERERAVTGNAGRIFRRKREKMWKEIWADERKNESKSSVERTKKWKRNREKAKEQEKGKMRVRNRNRGAEENRERERGE